jgi:hypothetical protein
VRAGTVPPLSRHHLVPRGRFGLGGGDDVDENLVPVCGDGSRGCHGAIERREPGYRQRLRGRLKAVEVAYVLGKRGAAWLDRHYPET